MSSEPPPQPVSDTFNYSQWNRDQNLTIAEAAMRYLSKVINDTATGVITFLQGIVTNTINATSVGSTLNIGNNLTNGNISIGDNLGIFGSIELGGGLSGIAGVYVGYLNATFCNTNNMSAVGYGNTMTINNSSPPSITNISSLPTRSGQINIGNGTNCTANVEINNGVGSTGALVLGTVTTTVEVNAPATFSVLPLVSASYGFVSGSSTSNAIITANWINSIWLVYLRTITNTWSDVQTFSALPLVSASYAGITGGDTSNTIITTNWLNTVWDTYFVTTTNTWSAIQTFSALPLITASYGGITGGNTSNTIITSNWLNSTWLPYLRGLANTWSAVQTFTSSISLSAPINPNYSYPVAAGLIGERVAGVTQSGTTTVVLDAANAQEDIATVDLTRGVWMITTHQTNPNVASSFQLLISSASATRQNTIGEMLVIGSTSTNLTSINVCGTVSINASATYYAVSRTSNAGGATLTNVFMYAFRIA